MVALAWHFSWLERSGSEGIFQACGQDSLSGSGGTCLENHKESTKLHSSACPAYRSLCACQHRAYYMHDLPGNLAPGYHSSHFRDEETEPCRVK